MLANLFISLCLMVFALSCLFVRKIDSAWRKSYNPLVLIGGSTLLYTITPWLAAPGGDGPILEKFLLMQLVSIAGMAVGTISAHLLFVSSAADVRFVAILKRSEKFILIAQVVGLILFLVAYNFFLGGLSNIVMFGYRNITEAENGGNVMITIQLILIQYAFPAVLVAAYLTGVKRVFFYVCASIYLLLLLASGTRNFLVMFVGNFILLSSIVRRRFSYITVSIMTGVLLLFMTGIGLYRNFGLDGRSEMLALYSAEGWKAWNPSTQELGTSYNVYQIDYSDPTWFPLAPGRSYLNAVLATVPSFIWRDRPDSISTLFSAYFAVPGEGLGFSNNLEAYHSAGLFGVFLVNAILLFACIVIYNRNIVEKVTIFGMAFYGNLVFVAFNWNRIDFQTVYKISMIRIVLFYMVASYLMSIANAAGNQAKIVRTAGRNGGARV